MASMIVFIAAGAIMEVASNIKKLSENLIEADEFKLKSSIVLLQQKDVKNLYEQLIDFNISDDEIISELKKDKIKLDISQSNENNLTVVKLKAYNDFFSNTAYELGIK